MITAADNETSYADKMPRVIGPVKYEITDNEFLQIYSSEPRLAMLMDMDVIRLIDNHLVVNLRQFITPKTRHLTAFAKQNLSACCIGVQLVSDEKQPHRKQNKRSIACTLDMVIKAAGFLEEGEPDSDEQSSEEQKSESKKIGDEIDRLNDIINSLPASFSGSLKALMKMKGYTEELLAEASWVSLSTIKQYRQDEGKTKTLKTVTALCIGMGLHPWLTEYLIGRSGVNPKATKLDSAYRYLYTAHYKDSIEDCNIYLRERGLPEFTKSDRAL